MSPLLVALAWLVLSHPDALDAQAAVTSDAHAPLAILGVTVIDVARGRGIPDQTVVVSEGRIVTVGPTPRTRVPRAARVLSGRGKFLIPGLMDTHVHLGWDIDSAATRELLHEFLAAGVTTVREASSRSTVPEQLDARRRIAAGRMTGPRLVIAGRIDARAVRRAGVSNPAALARLWASMGVDGLKIRSGLTREDVTAVIAEGRQHGLPVFGHTVDTTVSYATAAIHAGLAGVMHVEPLARELTLAAGAEPDAAPKAGDEAVTAWHWYWYVRWTLVDSAAEDRLARLMVARGVWLEPTLAISAKSVYPDRWRHDPRITRLPETLARDAADTTSLPIFRGDSLVRGRAAFGRMMRFVRRVHELGGDVLTGTDNAPVYAWGIHDELALLVEAGLSPAAALRAATLDAARALGLSRKTGTVTPGLAADLVLLDGDPIADIRNTQKIRAVIVRGRLLDGALLEPRRH